MIMCTVVLFTNVGGDENKKKSDAQNSVELYEKIVGFKWKEHYKEFLVLAAKNIKNKELNDNKMDSLAIHVIKKHEKLVVNEIVNKINENLTPQDKEKILKFVNDPIYLKYRKLLDELNSVNKLVQDSIGMEFMGKALGKIK